MYIVKKAVWIILNWLDNKINHTVVDAIMDHLPLSNKDGKDSVYYTIWENTFYKYCYWVNADLFEKWFPEEVMGYDSEPEGFEKGVGFED